MLRKLAFVAVPFALAACKKNEAPKAPTTQAPTTAQQPVKPPAPTAGSTNWREGIKSKDAKTRAEAVATISPAEGAAPAELVAALADAAPEVRRAAARALSGFFLEYSDAAALPKLLEQVAKEADVGVRGELVRALGALSHRDIVPALVAHLPKEKDAKVRDEIIGIFAKESDKRALPALADLLKDKEPLASAFEAVRRTASTAPPELVKLLAHASPATRKLAVQALGEIGERASVADVIKAASDGDAGVAAEAIAAIALLGGPRGVAVVIAAVDHKDPGVRLAAMRALGNYRSPEDIPADDALPKVLAHLKSDTAEVRIEAAKTLGAMKIKRGIEALQAIASNAKEANTVRMAALESLGAIGNGTGVATLSAALADADADVRTSAAKGVAMLRANGKPATKALMDAWKKGEADIDAQLEIVRTLGAIGAEEAMAMLEEAASKNAVPLVRAEAAGALVRLGNPKGVDFLKPIVLSSQEWQERRAAARLLEARGWKERKAAQGTDKETALSKAVTQLVADAIASEKEPLVRETLYRQLGRARGPEAIPAQRAALTERVPFFRLMGVAGLCANGDQAGCDQIIQAIDSPEAHVRAEAARRARWYNLAGAAPALRKAVDDPVSFVANAARAALNRIERGTTAEAAPAPKK